MDNVSGEFWEKFKARVKARWKQLSDEDIDVCRDSFESPENSKKVS